MNQHADEIFAKAYLFCYRSPENAREVVQELYPVLLTVLHRSPSGLRNPWAVVHCVAARLAIDCFRKQVRTSRVRQLTNEEDIVESRDSDSARTVDASEVHTALDMLPARLQTIVRGIFLEGRKAKDVAAQINLSEARVTELKQKALLQLRQLLIDAEES